MCKPKMLPRDYVFMTDEPVDWDNLTESERATILKTCPMLSEDKIAWKPSKEIILLEKQLAGGAE